MPWSAQLLSGRAGIRTRAPAYFKPALSQLAKLLSFICSHLGQGHREACGSQRGRVHWPLIILTNGFHLLGGGDVLTKVPHWTIFNSSAYFNPEVYF